jgi:sulfur-oxidizing protein SoxY
VLAGLLTAAGYPQYALAFNKNAFEAKTVQEAIKAAGGGAMSESKDVTLTGPDIAENGAVVPLGVSTSLTGVKELLILVEKNPNALVALFKVSDAIDANFMTRAKMGQSSDVYAVAIMNDGRALFSKKEVKVTLGGCGG